MPYSGNINGGPMRGYLGGSNWPQPQQAHHNFVAFSIANQPNTYYNPQELQVRVDLQQTSNHDNLQGRNLNVIPQQPSFVGRLQTPTISGVKQQSIISSESQQQEIRRIPSQQPISNDIPSQPNINSTIAQQPNVELNLRQLNLIRTPPKSVNNSYQPGQTGDLGIIRPSDMNRTAQQPTASRFPDAPLKISVSNNPQRPQSPQVPDQPPKHEKEGPSLEFHVKCFTKRWMPCAEFMLGDGCFNSDATCRFKHFLPAEFEKQAKHILGQAVQHNLPDPIFQAYLTAFYSHNIFLFGTRRGGDEILLQKIKSKIQPTRNPNLNASKKEWRLFRDPLATRLLDFVDQPDWKDKGSDYFSQTAETIDFRRVDKVRHQMKSICINLSGTYGIDLVPDWDWPLQVDWKSLPQLEYLQLDLRAYSRHPWMQMGDFYKPEEYHMMLEHGAKRMKCLELKYLSLTGLCSYCNWGNEDHERKMDALFRPAVREEGVISFIDTPLECIPFQPIRIDEMGLFAPLPGIGKPVSEASPREVPANKWLPLPNIPIEGNLTRFSTWNREELEMENRLMAISRNIPLNWDGKPLR